jgi:hypothetical protein
MASQRALVTKPGRPVADGRRIKYPALMPGHVPPGRGNPRHVDLRGTTALSPHIGSLAAAL